MLNANTTTTFSKRIERDKVSKDWNAYLNDEYIGAFKYSFQAEAELDRLAYEQLRRSAPEGVAYPEPTVTADPEAERSDAELQEEAWQLGTDIAKCGGDENAPAEYRYRQAQIGAILHKRRMMALEDAERVYARPAEPQPQAVYVATAEEPEAQPAEPQMPTYDELYAFVKRWYKHERFEARNEGTWCPDYSHRIVRSYMECLLKQGNGIISRHESVTGQALWFNRSLKFFEPWQGFLCLPFERQAVEANREGVGQDLPS